MGEGYSGTCLAANASMRFWTQRAADARVMNLSMRFSLFNGVAGFKRL
jgi:hypothetical protein